MTKYEKFNDRVIAEDAQLSEDIHVARETRQYSVREIESDGPFGHDNEHPKNIPYSVHNVHHRVDADDSGTHYTEHTHEMKYTDGDYPESADKFSQKTEKQFGSGKKVTTTVMSSERLTYVQEPNKAFPTPTNVSRINASRTVEHPDGTETTHVYSGARAERMVKAAKRLSAIYEKRRVDARNKLKDEEKAA